jgi:hypothetical protein
MSGVTQPDGSIAQLVALGASGGSGFGAVASLPADPVTTAATSTVNVQIIGANAKRKTLIIYNDSAGILYLRFGSVAATSSNFTLALAPVSSGIGGSAIILGQDWAGPIQGILSTSSGTARVTESQ